MLRSGQPNAAIPLMRLGITRMERRRTTMIHHSPFPEIDVPCTTVTEHALRHSDRLRTKEALIEPSANRSITFGELPGRIEQRALELKRYGVRPGDVVTFFAFNSI